MGDNAQLNLVDGDKIKPYLHQYSNKDPELGKLLCLALENVLKKRAKNLTTIDELPANAPDWLSRKWDEGHPWHRFDPKKDIRLASKISHITDWLRASIINDEPWLNKTDKQGRPLKLLKFGSVEQAAKEADKAMKKAQQKLVIEDDTSHVKSIISFDSGFRFVQLLDETALDRESACMGHCIGNGAYDEHVRENILSYYSLRDASNKPHATLEVLNEELLLKQCKGKQNQPPVEKYLPYIKAFAQKFALKIDSPTETGLLYINGNYYDLFHMPSELNIDDSLFIDNCDRDIKFPNKLSLKGDLSIEYGKKPVVLPKSLRVEGDINLSNREGRIDLPNELHVKGTFYLTHNAHVKELPENIFIGGSIEMASCASLERIPDAIAEINGLADFSGCTNLKKLPRVFAGYMPRSDKYISYQGALNLSGCINLEALPESLHVDGPLYLNGCKSLKTLPKRMSVNAKIFTDHGIYDSVDEFKIAFEKNKANQSSRCVFSILS